MRRSLLFLVCVATKSVRTNSPFIFIKSVPSKGDTTRGKRKLKQGQKTAFPFPLMVSPLHSSSLNPYSLPFFIPLHFACRRRPNSFHLFALFSIAMFTGFNFTPFFYLLFFCKSVSKFMRMCIKLHLCVFIAYHCGKDNKEAPPPVDLLNFCFCKQFFHGVKIRDC